MDSWKRFNERELPSYSTLNLEDISDDDYAHAINYGILLILII